MDKKAMDQLFTILMTALVSIIIVAVVLTIFRKGSVSTKNVLDGYIEALKEDFDKDGLRDFYDNSPCVAGEDLIIDEDGTKYYYFADPKVDPKDNNFYCRQRNFESAAQRYQDIIPPKKNPTVKDPDGLEHLKYPVIEKRTDISTGQAVCIISDTSCALALKYTYEEIREEQKAAKD